MATHRPRIGIDFHTWDGLFQGSRSHILGLYRAAIELAPDFDFVFFLNDTDSLKNTYPEFSRPNVWLIKTPKRPSWWRLLAQLPWMALKHRIDLLHTQYRLPLWTHARTACTIHDLLCESHPQFFSKPFVLQSKVTFRLSARLADALFTVSNYSKSELIHRYGMPPSKVAVTHNGVDRTRFHPSPQASTSDQEKLKQWGLEPLNYILTVGRLEPRKNQANLIRAWGQLGMQAPVLVVVGQPDFSFEDVRIAQAEVSQKVLFLDNIADDELPLIMRHAKLFAYPAFAEGFGMPVIEALASGVPVVTSNTTSMPEVAGPQAILVDPTQVASIQAGLHTGLQLPDHQRAQIIAAGLSHAESFRWADSARVLITHFRYTLLRS